MNNSRAWPQGVMDPTMVKPLGPFVALADGNQSGSCIGCPHWGISQGSRSEIPRPTVWAHVLTTFDMTPMAWLRCEISLCYLFVFRHRARLRRSRPSYMSRLLWRGAFTGNYIRSIYYSSNLLQLLWSYSQPQRSLQDRSMAMCISIGCKKPCLETT